MEHVTHRAIRTTPSLPAQRTPAPAEPGADLAEQFHYAERLAELRNFNNPYLQIAEFAAETSAS